MNMARKITSGEYQIGIYTVTRKGKYWEAFATGALGDFRHKYGSLREAHDCLTGEGMDDSEVRGERRHHRRIENA